MKNWWIFYLTAATLGIFVVILFVVRLRPVPFPSPTSNSTTTVIEEPSVTLVNPQKGAEKAKVTIVTFGDFQCVSCRDLAGTLDSLIQTYPNELRVIWKDFPNESVHPLAAKASIAAACAGNQDSFWPYHDELYRRQTYLSEEQFLSIAKDLSLNEESFASCLNNDETLPKVKRDFEEGLSLKITATPTIFIGKDRIVGAISLDELDSKVRELLK